MDGRKEEKKQIESVVAFTNNISPLANQSDTSFYQWLVCRGVLTVIEEAATDNEELEHISNLASSDAPLKEDMRRMPFHSKRKSDIGLETSISYSKKQTPPASPKLPRRRPNPHSPLLFPFGKEKNLDASPSEISLSSDGSFPPPAQALLDALLKELRGNPTHLLIAEKAIAKQRMLDQQSSLIVMGQ